MPQSTMRRGFDFRMLPPDILMMRECEIENISSHLNATKQGATFSSKEHQKFDENLKSAEVFTSCHIYGLLFYALRSDSSPLKNFLHDFFCKLFLAGTAYS
jgi:hypothetical protein